MSHIATLVGYVAPLVAHVAALVSHVVSLVAHVASLALPCLALPCLALPCSAWFALIALEALVAGLVTQVAILVPLPVGG